jgi:hypothetical protein
VLHIVWRNSHSNDYDNYIFMKQNKIWGMCYIHARDVIETLYFSLYLWKFSSSVQWFSPGFKSSQFRSESDTWVNFNLLPLEALSKLEVGFNALKNSGTYLYLPMDRMITFTDSELCPQTDLWVWKDSQIKQRLFPEKL